MLGDFSVIKRVSFKRSVKDSLNVFYLGDRGVRKAHEAQPGVALPGAALQHHSLPMGHHELPVPSLGTHGRHTWALMPWCAYGTLGGILQQSQSQQAVGSCRGTCRAGGPIPPAKDKNVYCAKWGTSVPGEGGACVTLHNHREGTCVHNSLCGSVGAGLEFF